MIDEGYIKYEPRWIEGPPPPEEELRPLMAWRDRLHGLGLIGVYPDGVGYGNISARSKGEGEFIISGTQTGGVGESKPGHFTLVTDVDIERNSLTCRGPVQASSEGMTHAAFYRCDRSIGAVIHIHHLPTWSALLDVAPTTDRAVPYGTPEMAREIERLYRRSDLQRKKLAVMGGHREGIIAFGKDLEEAGAVLLGAVRM